MTQATRLDLLRLATDLTIASMTADPAIVPGGKAGSKTPADQVLDAWFALLIKHLGDSQPE